MVRLRRAQRRLLLHLDLHRRAMLVGSARHDHEIAALHPALPVPRQVRTGNSR